MKKSLVTMCVVMLMGLAGQARAEMFKCVKDGKTTYQAEPCAGQGAAETKMQTSKPSSWVGCYESTGPGWESGTRKESFEIRQKGDKLYMPMGKEGQYENNITMRVASPEDLQRMKTQILGRREDAGVFGGLVAYEIDSGWKVTPMPADTAPRVGFYWIRAKAQPDTLYAFFPFAFDVTKKVPCPKG